MTTSERIKSLLEQRGITHNELAEKLGISVNSVHVWFLHTKNKRKVSDAQIKKMAEIFEVSEAYLRYGVGAGVENYTIHLKEGNVAFKYADNKYLIDAVKRKYGVDSDNIKRCYCYTEDMKEYISEGDILHVDFSEGQAVTNGTYILVIGDTLAVRQVRKDVFTKCYIISTPKDEAKVNEADWDNLVQHAYRVLMIEHAL